MAVPRIGEISSVTRKYFMPKLVDNIFNSNALMQRWRKNNYKRQGGGTENVFPVAYAATSASGWYEGADTLDIASNNQIDSATFDWKQAHASLTITKLDQIKNTGTEAVVSFVKSKVQIAEKTLSDNLGTGIFNAGTTAKAIIGIRLAFAGTGNTYGGISKTTSSWWRGQTDTASTVLTIPLMQGMQGDAQIDNDRFSVWVTTQDIFDSFYGLIQPQQRFQDSDTAKAGFTNMLYNGKPVIVDSHTPGNHLFGINENYISLHVHRDEDFRFEDFIKPVNQNVAVAHVYWTGYLECNNPRMQGMFTALTS